MALDKKALDEQPRSHGGVDTGQRGLHGRAGEERQHPVWARSQVRELSVRLEAEDPEPILGGQRPVLRRHDGAAQSFWPLRAWSLAFN